MSTRSTGIWLRPERSGRGPTPTFDRKRLAESGIAIADEGGLTAVTMRAVAQMMKTSSASLYRYVESRGELLELMIDHALGEFVRPAADIEWSAGLLAIARSTKDIYLRHPWLLDVGAAEGSLGPNAIANLECAIAVLAEHPATAKTKLEAVSIVNATVASLCRFEVRQQTDGRTVEQWQRDQAVYLSRMITPNEHPHLAGAFAQPDTEVEDGSADQLFDRVVTRVAAGLLLQ